MIVWATEFPLARGTTAQDLLATAKLWLSGSPILPWRGFAFGDEPVNEITRYEVASQVVSICRAEMGGRRWCGLQHVWVEGNEREWTTDIVGMQDADVLLLAVRLDCNLLLPGMHLPWPHKPHFVRQIVGRFGGGADSWLTVTDEPTLLVETQVDDAAALMHGTTAVRLPVVYVSAGPGHQPVIDVRQIARWLSGMAHVVVEPSRHFAFALAGRVERNNPYGGAVSVFWPRAIEPQVRFLPTDFATPKEMSRAIADRVRRALTVVRPTPELSWPFLRELVTRQRVEKLRAAGKADVQQYIEAFDAELAAKEALRTDAEREVLRLQAELRRAEAAFASSGGLIDPGRETAYYPGELKDAILYALEAARNSLAADGRRRDIIDDVIAANQKSGNDSELSEEIKRIFASSGELSAASRRALEDLGFQVTEEGKHYKAVYRGDGRYTFVISKSSSDHRAGKNLASQINRTLFK